MIRVVAPLLAVVAAGFVVAAGAGWLAPRPELTRHDARAFTADAMDALGFSAVSVSFDVVGDDYRTVPVWRTEASVDGGVVALAVQRAVGRAVFVADADSAGGPLLTSTQERTLAEYETDPAVDRRIARNLWASLAALVGAGSAFAGFLFTRGG